MSSQGQRKVRGEFRRRGVTYQEVESVKLIKSRQKTGQEHKIKPSTEGFRLKVKQPRRRTGGYSQEGRAIRE